ncbi:MAG: DUF3127 domain-containing protein [Candidatus Shikimatogenerans sp. JK-2022]|nr:DUF3127 domain-containing protein [Candidatus Shikimatogenerans bostrichidophilus]
MYIIGIIKNILEEEVFRNKFKKKSIILITEERYPQNIIIDFTQDKIELLNYIKKKDKVKVYINIKGREWINKYGKTKYFNTLQGWRIEKIKSGNWDEDSEKEEDYYKYNDDDEDDDDEDDDDEDDNDEDDNKNKNEYNKDEDKLPF